MTHTELAKQSILKQKYKPKVELLPIQRLTKEEIEAGEKEVLDLENMTQLTAIAKCWINQDRNYKTWVKTCGDYAEVAIDETVNKRFFYKSGIQEALPSVKNFTRKQMNMLFEAIYFEIIPDIILQYELDRDYTKITGKVTIEILNFMNGKKSVKGDIICSVFCSTKESAVKGLITKMVKRGILKEISVNSKLFYSVTESVKYDDNGYYLEEG